jgi:DNA-binding XRE family transcriptional regulator
MYLMKKTLKQLRKVAGLTQGEAAAKLGVSHDTLSRWENGTTHPTAPQIVDICRVYECKFDDIIWPETKKDA